MHNILLEVAKVNSSHSNNDGHHLSITEDRSISSSHNISSKDRIEAMKQHLHDSSVHRMGAPVTIPTSNSSNIMVDNIGNPDASSHDTAISMGNS